MAKVRVGKVKCEAITKAGKQCSRNAQIVKTAVEGVQVLWLFTRYVETKKYFCSQHGK